jgi:trehalose/maltose hydrolase-like predicted phosphorylase
MNYSASPFSIRTRETLTYGPEPIRADGHNGARTILLPTLSRSPDPAWLFVDEGFTLAREHEVESLFAIGNGYVGHRGSLAEGTQLSAPATFVAGVFEQLDRPGSIPQLMTLADWAGVRVWIDDHPLSMERGLVLEHRRILDWRRGVLWREWRHQDPDGRITNVVAFRLASLADRHLLLQSVMFTAENYNAVLRFESSIEIPPGVMSSIPADWKTRRRPERPNVLPLALRSPGRDVSVAFAAASQLLTSTAVLGEREIEVDERRTLERFQINGEIGMQSQLTRTISIYTSRDVSEPVEAALSHVNPILPKGIALATAAHESAWHSRWEDADVEVEGDTFLQQALRFAAYHLISAANSDDERVSVGARALTGESYKGHVFWDTELYMVPFYTFTHPPSARALLAYRYHNLDAAREKARRVGFRGAMYPWESADTGEETTPRTVIAPSGEVIRIRNGEMEIHITADIAFAVWQYWNATGDDEFFLQRGAEIMLETGRFWASRGAMDVDGAYHIRHVIGPDEYHDDVDDNAYTNLIAAWNLRRSAEAAQVLQQRWPDRWRELSLSLHLSNDELRTWLKLAESMFINFDPQTLLFEQFSGYFKKEPIDLKNYEPRSAAMDMILGHEGIQKTNVVKQADVLMVTYLLWEEIPADVRVANFRYYEPRTGHGSSLSPSIHALLAARFGERTLAQRYLKQAAEIDLGNNMGNAAGGVHAAAIGGLWQAMVFGFAGLQMSSDGLTLSPMLLPHWRRLAFPLEWRKRKLRVCIEPSTMRVTLQGPEPLNLRLTAGSQVLAEPGCEYVAEHTQEGSWKPWRVVR